MQKLCTIEWLKAASLGSRLTLNEGQKELTLSLLTLLLPPLLLLLCANWKSFFALSRLRLQSFSFCTSIQSNQPSLVLLLHAAAASSTAVKGEIQSASFPMWGCLPMPYHQNKIWANKSLWQCHYSCFKMELFRPFLLFYCCIPTEW